MSAGRVAPARPDLDSGVAAAVEIDVPGRWDALALCELLIPFHSFLVQHSSESWVVHARSPGCHEEPLADALAAIERWRAERGVEVRVRIDGEPLRDQR